jgi:hypothetical protein
VVQVDRGADCDCAKQAERQRIGVFSKKSQQHIATDGEPGDGDWGARAETFEQRNCGCDVVDPTGVVGLASEAGAGSTAAVIESEGANAQFCEFLCDADHVPAAVGSAKAVQQQGHVVPTFPADRGVIMQNQQVTVIQSKVTLESAVKAGISGKKRSANGLKICAAESTCRHKFRHSRK